MWGGGGGGGGVVFRCDRREGGQLLRHVGRPSRGCITYLVAGPVKEGNIAQKRPPRQHVVDRVDPRVPKGKALEIDLWVAMFEGGVASARAATVQGSPGSRGYDRRMSLGEDNSSGSRCCPLMLLGCPARPSCDTDYKA